MVPGGVPEARLAEAGFMWSQERAAWYHQVPPTHPTPSVSPLSTPSSTTNITSTTSNTTTTTSNTWYHQGTEFGRRKAETEERSIEKLVNYLEVRHLFRTITEYCQLSE